MSSTRSTVFALTLLALAASCGPAAQKRHTQLRDDVRGYNDGIRWKNLPMASVRIPPAEREAFLDEREDVDEELRIGDYEIRRLRYSKSRNRAVVHIKWTWHMDNQGIVRQTTSRQMWRRHGKRWLMVEEYRVKGDEMPGVPEPPEDGSDPDELAHRSL